MAADGKRGRDGDEAGHGRDGGSRPAAGKARAQARAPEGAKSPDQVDPSEPLTTRPTANERREPPTPRSSAPAHTWRNRRFDAVPDRVDLRDWPYQPRLVPLPDVLVTCDSVPEVLDQEREGACTGFALAAVINYLLHDRGLINPRLKDRFVSPRMLYEMARRYDEWPGEDYDGSSARGAMKGWVAHGVCRRANWPDAAHGADHFTQALGDEAQESPGGAFFRVSHRDIRDMHSALNEVGILYVTLMVHDGWFFPGVREPEFRKLLPQLDENGKLPKGKRLPDPKSAEVRYTTGPGNSGRIVLPEIQRIGRAESGHAVAIVGYTADGFIVQNSWGRDWGTDGFALLPYEDYMLHATDVWVAQLGVPVKLNLWSLRQRIETDSLTGAGISRAAQAVPLSDIRPYVIDIGNDGRLSDTGDYFTTETDLRELVDRIPAYARDRNWSKRRVLFYLHGGLNDERGVAARIVTFRDVCLANEIYPVHVMWETGVRETLRNILDEFLTGPDDRAGGVRDWIDRFREGLVEAKDRSIEVTLARAGRALWEEMKENAEKASGRADRRGAMQQLSTIVRDRLRTAAGGGDGKDWELHVIGHSAGSIFVAHAVEHLLGLGIPLKTLQFFAPAVTVKLFKDKLLKPINERRCPLPSLYLLSDTGERDDSVGPYGKSLLYLVSNAFEERHDERDRRRGYVPLLGMYRFLGDVNPNEPGGEEAVDPEMRTLFEGEFDGKLNKLVVASAAARGEDGAKTGNVSESRSHGGFDNDYNTLNSALYRILGPGNIRRPFTTRDLQY